ncbi:MAG: 1-deoxy-D-xylulose-5-phosphate synthase, partial [Desulfovibrio sp.]
HGAFDLSFLRHIPNLILMAPKDEDEMQDLLYTAIEHNGPSAIRYPRGVGVGAKLKKKPELIPVGQGELLQEGGDLLVIALGSRVFPSLVAARDVEEKLGKSIAVFNARFVKPLPESQILDLVQAHDTILIAEENVVAGGFSSAVLELLNDKGVLAGKTVKRLGIQDMFVEHGPQKALRKKHGIGVDGLREAMTALL